MKKLLLGTITIIILIFIYISNYEFIKNTKTFNKLKKTLAYSLSSNVSTFIRIITNVDGHLFEHYNNDYKVKFLPATQFIDLDIKKIKLDFLTKHLWGYRYSFDLIEDYLVIATPEGQFYIESISKIINNDEDQINFKKLKTNLEDLILPGNLLKDGITDIFINDKKIYILAHEKKNNCNTIYLYSGSFNLNSINFENIFSTKKIIECVDKGTSPGRIQALKVNGEKNLLVSFSNKQQAADVYKEMSELENESIEDFGSILSINEKTKEFKVYAKGFRNSKGLYVDEKVIMSTDNGPRGGDEINKVIENKHYGWPYASYGERYKKFDRPTYKKDHKKYGFQEPVHSFIYALGMGEIIKLDNSFSEYWQNNFLVSTLNSKHLLRLKFDDEFNRIIYNEKIFIGERVRDLKYNSKNKKIFIGLNSTGSLGIISKKEK
tara:strand:- start:288 stop:1592 length:1305 start_codon:yes stop_codon:yes gene_type:complete